VSVSVQSLEGQIGCGKEYQPFCSRSSAGSSGQVLRSHGRDAVRCRIGFLLWLSSAICYHGGESEKLDNTATTSRAIQGRPIGEPSAWGMWRVSLSALSPSGQKGYFEPNIRGSARSTRGRENPKRLHAVRMPRHEALSGRDPALQINPGDKSLKKYQKPIRIETLSTVPTCPRCLPLDERKQKGCFVSHPILHLRCLKQSQPAIVFSNSPTQSKGK